MSTIIAVANRVKTLASTLQNEVPAIIERTKETIADIQATQLSTGTRSDGTKTDPEYRPLTKDLKQGLPGLAGVTDRVTLYNTGDFYRNLTVVNVDGVKFEITSVDPKTAKLEEKYGEKILGLNRDNKELYAKGAFFKELKEYIQRTSLLKLT